jgi:YHS domain-containing protein
LLIPRAGIEARAFAQPKEPIMKAQLFLLLLLAGCAGPTAHRTARDDSSLALSQTEAVRAPVASTLISEDPLEAPSCGLGSEPCAPAEPESKPMKHHHPPAGAPESSKPMEPSHQKPADAPAQAPEPAAMPPHHHGAMKPKAPAPAVEAAPASVLDPVCKMKIDPTKAKGGSLTVDGKTSFFCSAPCRKTFLSQHPGAK